MNEHNHSLICIRLDKRTKEGNVDESSSSHCFTDLEPESLYRISVYSILGSAEGTAVTILHPTGLTDTINAVLFTQHIIFILKHIIIQTNNNFALNLASAPARIPIHPRMYPIHNEGDSS